jgi:hypothetical protein
LTRGVEIFSAQTDGPDDFVPGATLSAAMPCEGAYVVEVIFVKRLPGGDTEELAKASFDFSVAADAADADVSRSSESNVPLYAWIISAFAVGIIVEKFGGRVYASRYSN